MQTLIAWCLVGLACLGALYAIGLIVAYVILPKGDDLYDVERKCKCAECKGGHH